MNIKDFFSSYGSILAGIVTAIPGLLALYVSGRQNVFDFRIKKKTLDEETRKTNIEEKDATIERADKINKMYEGITLTFEKRVRNLEDDKKQKDVLIAELQQNNKELNILVAALEIKVSQRDNMITDRDKRIASLEKSVIDKDQRITALESEVQTIENELSDQFNGIQKLIKQFSILNIIPVWTPASGDRRNINHE